MNLFRLHILLLASLFILSKQTFALEIKSVAAAGSACRASEKVQVSASDNGMEIMVPALKTDRAKGKKLFRSNCNLSIALDGEAGKQFKVVAIKTGYQTVGTNKDELNLNFKLWFQGESKTVTIDHKIDTSKGTELNTELSLPIEEDSWSACNKEKVLNAGVSFIGKNQSGFSNEYSLSQAKGIKIELLWRPCN